MFLSSKPIVIIGAGEAGVSAAASLRSGGYDGRVILLSNQRCAPYQLPPLSKDCLKRLASPPVPIKEDDWYAAQGVEIIFGATAVEIDATGRQVIFRENNKLQKLKYKKLVCTTGSRARRFIGKTPFKYLRSMSDCEQLRPAMQGAECIAIVGGGIIGLEIASFARELGKRVRLFEAAPRLMARALPEPISRLIESLHRMHGVEVNLATSDIAVDSSGFSVGGKRILADLYVAGIGALPNAEVAQNSGGLVDDGIVVDSQGQTSMADVYAAGDVARFYHPIAEQYMRVETWQHAQRHGGHVGHAMVKQQPEFDKLPWFWTDQFGINFQTVGFPALAEKTIRVGNYTEERATYVHLKGARIVAATTLNNGRDIRPLSSLITNRWQADINALMSPSVSVRSLLQSQS